MLLSLIAHGFLLSAVSPHRVEMWPLGETIDAKLLTPTLRNSLNTPLGNERAKERATPEPLSSDHSARQPTAVIPSQTVDHAGPMMSRHEVSQLATVSDGVKELRLALARLAKLHKVYPSFALQSGWEGVVEISLAVFPTGQAVFNLRKSSGFDSLDDEAMRLLRTVYPHVNIPTSLRSQSFEVVLPIEFRLE